MGSQGKKIIICKRDTCLINLFIFKSFLGVFEELGDKLPCLVEVRAFRRQSHLA